MLIGRSVRPASTAAQRTGENRRSAIDMHRWMRVGGPTVHSKGGLPVRYFGLSEPAHYWNTVLEMNDYVRNRDRIDRPRLPIRCGRFARRARNALCCEAS